MKKSIFNKIILLILSLILSFTIISCNDDNNPTIEEKYVSCDYCELKLFKNETFDFHTTEQATYLKTTYLDYDITGKGKQGKAQPNSLTLRWAVKNPNNYKLLYICEISKNEDFSDSKEIETVSKSATFYNFLCEQTYYWRVSVKYNGEIVLSDSSSINCISKTIRNLKIEGCDNFRDIGNKTTYDGKKIKQELLYRCAKFNSGETCLITDNGLAEINLLGIKNEIDLRKDKGERGYITASTLPGVGYHAFEMEWDCVMLDVNTEDIKNFFKFISDESNLPAVFHCSIGTDRTGLLAFLLEAYLGVTVEQLYYDYLWSNFALINSERKPDVILSYIKYFNANVQGQENVLLKQNIKTYLINIGVTEEELNNIESIFLE